MMKYYFFLGLLSTFLTPNLNAQHIFRTACQGNETRLDSLLQTTTSDTIDARGRSLVHWAVACRKPAILDYLIAQGIPTNMTDNEGKTPLHMSVRFNSETLFDKLIAQPDYHQWVIQYSGSLFEIAILKRNLAFVKKLLESGANINKPNHRGSVPLEIAQRIQASEISAYLISAGADQGKVRSFSMNRKYFNQKRPKSKSKVFAPNFISTEESEFGSVFNAAGTEFYYGVDVNGKNEIRFTKRTGKRWSAPITIVSHERFGYNDPFLSPDEQRLYFISNQTMDGTGELKDHDIWFVERQGNSWSEPINAGSNINSSGNEYYISFTQDGSMYFSSNINAPEERKRSDLDIYYAPFSDGKFQVPISLGDSINTSDYEADVFVDPKEDYLIFCGIRDEGFGRGDLYISFKREDGQWSKAINMGENINTEHHELCPFVSADGKFLFFTSKQDIYWISTKIIKDLRKQYLK